MRNVDRSLASPTPPTAAEYRDMVSQLDAETLVAELRSQINVHIPINRLDHANSLLNEIACRLLLGERLAGLRQ